jgi:uncharacterized coiled-coil protein SlyX
VISSPDLDLEATVAVQAMVIDQLREANARLVEANAALAARVAELERRLGKDSSNSSRPPSSEGLGKPPAPRQQRRRGGGRAPGKQPRAPGAHLAQVPDPDEVVVRRRVDGEDCGWDLTLAPVTGVEARQVFDLVGAENSSTSCDLGIFVDEAPQTIDPHDPHVPSRSGRWDGRERGGLPERAVWPMFVVVGDIARQHCLQLPSA